MNASAKIRAATGLAAAMLLALALPLSPAQAENERTKGTIVGATVGLIIGDGKAAVVGGLVGNLTGAMIKQERKNEAETTYEEPAPAASEETEEDSQ